MPTELFVFVPDFQEARGLYRIRDVFHVERFDEDAEKYVRVDRARELDISERVYGNGDLQFDPISPAEARRVQSTLIARKHARDAIAGVG